MRTIICFLSLSRCVVITERHTAKLAARSHEYACVCATQLVNDASQGSLSLRRVLYSTLTCTLPLWIYLIRFYSRFRSYRKLDSTIYILSHALHAIIVLALYLLLVAWIYSYTPHCIRRMNDNNSTVLCVLVPLSCSLFACCCEKSYLAKFAKLLRTLITISSGYLGRKAFYLWKFRERMHY